MTPPGSTNEDDIRLLDLDQPLGSSTGRLHVHCLGVMVHIFVVAAYRPASSGRIWLL